MNTFLWHDYETFGSNPRLDRPCQFAAVRTDADFNEIGEPLNLYCRPTLDVLPQPDACLVTGITPQYADEQGLDEPDFIARVLEALGAPGTCGVGYNSLRFDDEVTRHTAWRNFHDPYAREWQNGCSRWDLIDTVRLTYALRPEGLRWPARADGQPSFRLEDLASANGLEQARAHDAVSDVRATIALARLIRERQPRLLNYVLEHRDKASAWALLDTAREEPVAHVSARFPARYGCLSLILPIAVHPVNRNAVLCADLRYPPDDLLSLDADDIADRLFTPAADLPDGVERIAVKAVHVNRAPVLAPLATVGPEQAERLSLDLAVCRERAAALRREQPAVAAKLAQAFAQADFDGSTDPEQNLYGGFVDREDRRICDRILAMSWAERAEFRPRFSDRRLDALWFRYRGRHLPESLEPAEREEWESWRARRIQFAPDGGLTLDEFEAVVAARLAGGPDPERTRVLAELQRWGAGLRRLIKDA